MKKNYNKKNKYNNNGLIKSEETELAIWLTLKKYLLCPNVDKIIINTWMEVVIMISENI